MSPFSELRCQAIEVRQGDHRVLYSFAVDGKLLPTFATVSRLHRDADDAIGGYQRPEVLSHIAEIRGYLESPDPMIPNAIVIAFDQRVRFEPVETQPLGTRYTRIGTLVIPVDDSCPAESMPGWIVDGQQRAAAIRDAELEQFPICVTAFISHTAQEQREQFILVNSTRPLPKGLIYELLPSTEARLPSTLERRKLPAFLLNRLNHDADSPLRGMIQTPTVPGGVIKDNSILKMLEHSLSDGTLFHVSRGTEDPDEVAVNVLKNYWSAVEQVFPEAWGLPPRKSRLMHGAGIIAMGFVMDAIADRYGNSGGLTIRRCVDNLTPLSSACRWTRGEWSLSKGVKRRWDDIQNTPQDVEILVDFLLSTYRQKVWSKRRKRAFAG